MHPNNSLNAEPCEASNNPSPTGSQHGPTSELDPVRDREQGEVAQNTPLPWWKRGWRPDMRRPPLHWPGTRILWTPWQPSVAMWSLAHWERYTRLETRGKSFRMFISGHCREAPEIGSKTLDTGPQWKGRVSEGQRPRNTELVKTGTISKILRHQVPQDQILRCRWILTWKSIDDEEKVKLKLTKNVKAKARLVILGYLDPKIDEVPRDSPTLGRHSKMLLLQLIASKGWSLRSFDIKARFLQGKNQKDRILAIEPVPEIIKMMGLTPQEICKLEKGAYVWWRSIHVVPSNTRRTFGFRFQQSPFDPCLFILRDSNSGQPDGILGLHVDDGLCAGNERFLKVLEQLEKKYPFGSKRVSQFTFTGIDMSQNYQW